MTRIFLWGLIAICSACSQEPVDSSSLPEPIQSAILDSRPLSGALDLKPVASFDAKVLILSKREYENKPSDPLSAHSPYDIAVAWGEAGRKQTRKGLKIVQVNRRYAWSFTKDDWARTSSKRFGHHSANWHLIPMNEEVQQAIAASSDNEIVHIEGDLVDIGFPNGRKAKTSLTRRDAGDGSCEIIFVRRFSRQKA